MKLKLMSCLAALSAVALFTPASRAQTSDSPTLGKIVDDTFTGLKAASSNVWVAAYYMHAPSLPQKNGGGLGLFWKAASLDSTNISVRTLAGTRLDWVNGGFWMPSGNVTIDVPIKPLAWTGWGWAANFQLIPLVYAGIGIPVSGARFGNFAVPGQIHNNNGDPTAIIGAGLAMHVFTYKAASIDLAYDRETWSGFPGTQDRFGLAINLKR